MLLSQVRLYPFVWLKFQSKVALVGKKVVFRQCCGSVEISEINTSSINHVRNIPMEISAEDAFKNKSISGTSMVTLHQYVPLLAAMRGLKCSREPTAVSIALAPLPALSSTQLQMMIGGLMRPSTWSTEQWRLNSVPIIVLPFRIMSITGSGSSDQEKSAWSHTWLLHASSTHFALWC